MREPAFWWRPGGGSLLKSTRWYLRRDCGFAYAGAWSCVSVPVICLGNLTVGGAGKTPAALTVAHLLLAARERPFFLSRGYGGKLPGPLRVDPVIHSAIDVGDEPLLLARLAPTIVARDRVKGAESARRGGATVIVMDDGFQNPALPKDLAILMVDGRRGIGNGRTLPAGPLRAPLETQLARAQALVFVGPPVALTAVADRARHYGAAIYHGRLEPDRQIVTALGGRKVLAFAGIGDPEKFFATLSDAGINVAARAIFPDHHRYRAAEAKSLLAQADAANLMLVTTEKDLARFSSEPDLSALAARTTALPVRLVIEEANGFRDMILNAVKRHAAPRTP